MKIGIDCRLWEETGVGRYARNLVLNLQKIDKKNEYVLFVLRKDREEILKQVLPAGRQGQNDSFRIIEADIRWHSIAEQLRFLGILSKENLDLVHFPYFSVPLFYNKPFVVTIHDLIINHFPTGLASTLPFPIYSLKLIGYKFVMSQAVKKAKKILTVSNATKEEIVDHLGVDSKKVVVTYEGISQKLAVSGQKSAVKGKYFLYVGNAYPHKNLEKLLEAFKTLNSNVSLVFVGKEDYFYKRLKKKVEEMNLSDKVIFLENVTDEELFGLYKNALALVIPSLMEGFGLPALEAMANKCLVLSSNIPSLREVCGDAAIYFDPYNVTDVVRKMKEVLLNDSNHFTEEIKRGLDRVKLFSWEKMAKETLEVYESSFSL